MQTTEDNKKQGIGTSNFFLSCRIPFLPFFFEMQLNTGFLWPFLSNVAEIESIAVVHCNTIMSLRVIDNGRRVVLLAPSLPKLLDDQCCENHQFPEVNVHRFSG